MHGPSPWLTVDLAAIERNARRFMSQVGVPVMPMVKANGYGLGAVAVARALEPVDPWGYGVASLAEARTLREAGIERPIMAFWPFRPEWIDEYLALEVRPAIGDLGGLDAWLSRSGGPFHLELDTGMGRAGFRWHDADALAALPERLAPTGWFEGVFTHFASADTSLAATEAQWARFAAIVASLGRRPPLVHAANSGAGQWGHRFAGSLARPGIFLYGGTAGTLIGEPVARLDAVVVAVRPIRAGDPVSYGAGYLAPAAGEVATLAIGYADGVHRTLGNTGVVSIGDRQWPIAGRVTMDMTMVVAPRGAIQVGQVATIFGGPVGLDAQAERAGTISYELLTAVGPRVVRRYREAG